MSLERQLGIKEGERLATVARKAVVTVLPTFVFAGIVFAAPFFFLRPFLKWGTLGYVLIGALLAAGAFALLRTFVKWRGTLLGVTERRLIVVGQHGFFSRAVTELPFDKIHEVSYRVHGVAATLFGYGSLLIESAGSAEPIEMPHVRRPAELHRLVSELQQEAAGGPGDFGAMLQAVSRLDERKLAQLKAEIERTLKSRV